MDFSSLISDAGGAEKALARRAILRFAGRMMPQYIPNWHHELLCSYLDRFARGEIKRLMIFMPPQHAKSTYSSVLLPAYLLGKNPDARVILSSYAASKAEEFNADCQRIIDSEEYAAIFPNTKLQPIGVNGKYKRNTERFDIVDHKGFMKTVGVGGGLTGTSADFAIIDDPVKDSVEATSPTTQEAVWKWYNDVLFTRIHNNSGILIIQTRWDVNDLSGKLLDLMAQGLGEQFTILELPAIKISDDNPEDPRKIGEALWPEMHSLEKLRQIERQSIRTFQSLYQQNPQPVQAGGECYKMFDRNRTVNDFPYDPSLSLHLSFDFNVNPYMAAGVYQIHSRMIGDTKYYKAIKIKEICLKTPRNSTRSVCAEFCRLFPNHKEAVFVYGDPNGYKQDTRSEKGHNDYRVIRKELKRYNPSLRVATKAPSVPKRIEFMNALFEGGYEGLEYYIDRSCTKTIDDYQFIKEDAEGGKFKQTAKDPSTGVVSQRYGHCSDHDEYFITMAFGHKYTMFLNGGKLPAPKLGKRVSRHLYQ